MEGTTNFWRRLKQIDGLTWLTRSPYFMTYLRHWDHPRTTVEFRGIETLRQMHATKLWQNQISAACNTKLSNRIVQKNADLSRCGYFFLDNFVFSGFNRLVVCFHFSSLPFDGRRPTPAWMEQLNFHRTCRKYGVEGSHTAWHQLYALLCIRYKNKKTKLYTKMSAYCRKNNGEHANRTWWSLLMSDDMRKLWSEASRLNIMSLTYGCPRFFSGKPMGDAV